VLEVLSTLVGQENAQLSDRTRIHA
jgi:hypothetical protein